jgi:hypothetical protein
MQTVFCCSTDRQQKTNQFCYVIKICHRPAKPDITYHVFYRRCSIFSRPCNEHNCFLLNTLIIYGYIIAIFMKHNIFWEANSRLAVQENLLLLWYLVVFVTPHNVFLSWAGKYSIYIRSTSSLLHLSLPSVLLFLSFPITIFMRSNWFIHLVVLVEHRNIWRRVQIMKPFNVYFFRFSCYFLLESKYSSERSIL